MDPMQVSQILQGGALAPGVATAPTPQQLLTIQNLMKKDPGGLGAMPSSPGQMMQPPMPPPQASPMNQQQGMGQMPPNSQLMQLMGTPSGQ
jgi:hypothetical protein